jgi:hypothetical protein
MSLKFCLFIIMDRFSCNCMVLVSDRIWNCLQVKRVAVSAVPCVHSYQYHSELVGDPARCAGEGEGELVHYLAWKEKGQKEGKMKV